MYSATTDDSPSTSSAPDWKRVPLPDATPKRHRNVSRLRAMSGDVTCVPPDFNSGMLAIWEELQDSMPKRKIGVTVHELLKLYQEHCRAERKRPRSSSESPPALLPVSFALAKDWVLRQQKLQSEAIQCGAVNEEAREVAADLSRSLSEQSATTARLLEQPAPPAAVVIPPPAMSLGPEPVTAHDKEQEKAVEQPHKKAAHSSSTKKAPPAKKKKRAFSPETEERRARAMARLKELGVQPLKVSI